MYRDGLKSGPVLLSNSQAGPGRKISQPRDHFLLAAAELQRKYSNCQLFTISPEGLTMNFMISPEVVNLLTMTFFYESWPGRKF